MPSESEYRIDYRINGLTDFEFNQWLELMMDRAKLCPRYRTLIGLRFQPGYQYTLQETADTMRMSKERAWQIEQKALAKLKTAAGWKYTRDGKPVDPPAIGYPGAMASTDQPPTDQPKQ